MLWLLVFMLVLVGALLFAGPRAAPVKGSAMVAASASQLAADEDAINELMTSYNCQHIYLDVGTNIAVQIRKLYEPQKYAGAAVLKVFDEYFGTGAQSGMQNL